MEKKALKFVQKLSRKAVEDNVFPDHAEVLLRNAIGFLPQCSIRAELTKNVDAYAKVFSDNIAMDKKNILQLCTAVGLQEAEEDDKTIRALSMLPCCAANTLYVVERQNVGASEDLRSLEDFKLALKALSQCIQKDSTLGGYCSLYIDTQSAMYKTAFYMKQCVDLVHSAIPLLRKDGTAEQSQALVDTILLLQRILSLSYGRSKWIKASTTQRPTTRFALPINNMEYDTIVETNKLFATLIVLCQHIVPDKGLRLDAREHQASSSGAQDDTDSDDEDHDQPRSVFSREKMTSNIKLHCELGENDDIVHILLDYEVMMLEFAAMIKPNAQVAMVAHLYQYAMLQYRAKRVEDDAQQYLQQILLLRCAQKAVESAHRTRVSVHLADFVRQNPNVPASLTRWLEMASHNGTRSIDLVHHETLSSDVAQRLLKGQSSTKHVLQCSTTMLLALLQSLVKNIVNYDDNTNSTKIDTLFFTDTAGTANAMDILSHDQHNAEVQGNEPDAEYDSDASSIDSQPEHKRQKME